MKQKVDKHFVSEIDKRLAEFHQTQPKTASEQAEIDKHAQVFALRDNPDISQEQPQDDLWD